MCIRDRARADKAKWLERQCEDIEKYYGEYKTREVYQVIGDINRKWQLENVEKFTCLGSNMTFDLDCSKEIAIRIAKAMANLKALDKIWKSKAITLETKLSILKT